MPSCLDTVVQVTSHHKTGYFQRLNERLDKNVPGDFIEVVAGHILIEISWHTYFLRKKYYRAQNCAGESSAHVYFQPTIHRSQNLVDFSPLSMPFCALGAKRHGTGKNHAIKQYHLRNRPSREHCRKGGKGILQVHGSMQRTEKN